MPEADIDRIYGYPPEFLAGISDDETKFSYGVLWVLHETGYEMLPVNSNPNVNEICWIKVYRRLHEINRPVDLIEVFRPKEYLYGIAQQAKETGVKALYGRLGSLSE